LICGWLPLLHPVRRHLAGSTTYSHRQVSFDDILPLS
jgi:hypothetical protein